MMRVCSWRPPGAPRTPSVSVVPQSSSPVRGDCLRRPVRSWGGAVPTVRNVIDAVHRRGVEGLARQSHRPKTGEPVWEASRCDRLPPLLPQSPRLSGKATGGGPLALAAAGCSAPGGTAHRMSEATLRRARKRLAPNWKRAQPWLTSPAPYYGRKKRGAIAGWPSRWGTLTGSSGARMRWGGAAPPRPPARRGPPPRRCA